MHQARLARLSPDSYLEGELGSDIRHEYVDGEVFAMAGAGEAHNLIAMNVASGLRGAARGGPCRIFISDMKVRVAAWNAFYYPDILATCDPSDTQTYFKEHPCLIVEVLSPSTERTDRRDTRKGHHRHCKPVNRQHWREKLLAYRMLESLREYVLISQDQRRVEVYRRAEDGAWSLETLSDGDALRLECVNATLTLDEVYEDVSLASPSDGAERDMVR